MTRRLISEEQIKDIRFDKLFPNFIGSLPTINLDDVRDLCEAALSNEWVTPLDIVTKAKRVLEKLKEMQG